MDDIVTPSAQELEYLARVIERAVTVRSRAGLSSWSQGLVQTLLPHAVMVCLRFDTRGDPCEMLCLHNDIAHARLEDRLCALAVRLAAICRRQYRLPCQVDSRSAGALAEPWREVALSVPGAVLLHGSGELRGESTMFALFGMPEEGKARHRYFAELLLPCMHLAWQRQVASPAADQAPPRASPLEDPLTQRELEILRRMQEGKINADIGAALGISAHTVKKHIFNIYRKLAVQNRIQALSRASALALIGHAA
jgi:transcriptional regulator EpsA